MFSFCVKPLHDFVRMMTSADKCFKQLSPRSGQTFCLDLIRVQTV